MKKNGKHKNEDWNRDYYTILLDPIPWNRIGERERERWETKSLERERERERRPDRERRKRRAREEVLEKQEGGFGCLRRLGNVLS